MMDKTDIVDEMGHTFLTEQGYMVQADDIEGIFVVNNTVKYKYQYHF